jgi:hypothetical protein
VIGVVSAIEIAGFVIGFVVVLVVILAPWR